MTLTGGFSFLGKIFLDTVGKNDIVWEEVDMNIEMVDMNSIRPYAKNPRINDAAVDGVIASIREFGFQNPILIDNENVIIAGHTRYKAALKLNLHTVPCLRIADLSPTQIQALRLVDNKTAEKSTWDFAMLEEEICDIDMDLSVWDLKLPEFHDAEVDNPAYKVDTDARALIKCPACGHEFKK